MKSRNFSAEIKAICEFRQMEEFNDSAQKSFFPENLKDNKHQSITHFAQVLSAPLSFHLCEISISLQALALSSFIINNLEEQAASGPKHHR
jgi:hypothetical protein